MRLVAIALTAMLGGSEPFAPAAPQLAQAAFVQPISIRVDAPARTGLPIWVFADLQGPLTARYPYGEDPLYLGSNRLELKRDGQTLPPQPGFGRGGPVGVVVGSIAPPRAPQNRLPLHLAFAIDKPGRYSVRWSVVGERREAGPPPSRRDELLAQSNWLEFDVKTAKLSEREAWLRRLLAARPTDDAAYVGDYLPSLLAGAPDARVARAMIDGTYSDRELIASCTFGGLRLFPAEVAVPLTLESLHRRGPSRGLAYFVSRYASWFQDRREEVVGTAASFLRSNDDAVAEAAVQMLIFARGFDWPADATALREADHAVEAAAPSLMTRSDGVVRALGSYPATRDLLWEEIERRPAERASALLALTQIGDLRDLARIGDLLLQPGEKDPRGTELAGLVYHLANTYGEAAIPYIQRALTESPYVWVRTQSAEQLALKGRVEAFRFFLDATTANRSYRSELENWLRVTFHLPANNAPNRVDERNGDPALLAFLNERIRDPKPPPEDSPIRAAVARLQSTDASDRKAGAQILLDLAPQGQEYMINVGAYLFDDVIRRPARVNKDAWRDAALILGRLHHGSAAGLTLYLERAGASEALMELGEPAVPAVTDVLKVGGPARRRLAAEVLGAIGGPRAVDALKVGLNRERDAGVKKAIQTALSHVGQRPPRAEIQ